MLENKYESQAKVMDKRFKYFNIPYKELKETQKEFHQFDQIGKIMRLDLGQLCSSLFKNGIVKFAAAQGLRLSMRLKKDEMLERFREYLADPQTIREPLFYMSDLCYKTLIEKVFNQDDDQLLNAAEWFALSQLEKVHLCQWISHEFYIFDTTRLSIIKQIMNEPDFNEKRQKYSFMRGLLNYVDMVFEIIDEDHLYSIYKQKFPVSKEEFFTLYNDIKTPSMIYHVETHEFISNHLTKQDIEKVRSEYRSHVFSLIDVKEIEDYINYGYPQNEHYDYLCLYLLTVLDEDPLVILDYVRSLYLTVASGHDLVNYMNAFVEKFKYPENKEMGVVVLCILLRVLECYAYTRSFESHGQSIMDILKSNPTLAYSISSKNEKVNQFILDYREELEASGYEITDKPQLMMKIKTFEKDADDKNFDFTSYKAVN